MRRARLGERGLTRSDRWPGYLAGMLTEIGFILALTAVALALAIAAKAVF